MIRTPFVPLFVGSLLMAGFSFADFVLVDDFNRADSTTLGTSAIGNSWQKTNGTDEGPTWARISNQSLTVSYDTGDGTGANPGLTLDLDSATTDDIGPSGTGTLFLRFRQTNDTGDPWNLSVGLSDLDAATAPAFANFEAQASLRSQADATLPAIRPRNGVDTNLTAGTWYNLWIVADVGNNTADYWISTGTDDATTQVGDDLAFRNGTASELVSFLLVGSNDDSDTVEFDDIYYDDAGLNLSYAVPEPSTLVLAAVAAGLLLFFRRRRS